MIELDQHDQALVEVVRTTISSALSQAHSRTGVAKRITSEAVKHRNRGRKAAIRRHPFSGICEASGAPLDKRDAVLDELEPERGYDGKVQWVCPKANNSGRRSCGKC